MWQLEVITCHGGCMERKVNSSHKVSFWHIPNGTQYDMTVEVEAFFDSLSDAEMASKELERRDRTSIPIIIPL